MTRKVLLLTVLMACTTADQSPLSTPIAPTVSVTTPPAAEPLVPAPQPATTANASPTTPTALPTSQRPITRPAPQPSAPAQPIPASSPAPNRPSTSTLTNAPDILVLGDSQISFGAGGEYLDFFQNLPQRCGVSPQQVAALGQRQTAAIGVRSTSLASWTARDDASKGTICDVDERFGVNAGSYGIQGNDNLSFVQIGRGDDYQFCEPEKSPFEAAFAPGNYDPKLLVLTFLGNSADRWANNPTATAQDVQRTLSQIPSDIPCIFFTSVPVFEQATNDTRMRAQTAIIDAFEQAGGHCQPVAGFTRQTRNAIEGQLEFFRQRDDGTLADPFHPRPAATRLFLDLNAPQLCDAVLDAIARQ